MSTGPETTPEIAIVHSADGTRLHTEVHGAAGVPTLVLAHGILCATPFWRRIIDALVGEYRIVAYDQRGHGRSESPRRGHYTLDHLGDDLAAVLDATTGAGERVVIAGHSMGGIAVLAWAARYPEQMAARVSAVALINSTPGEILDNVRFLRGPERLLGARRRLAHAVVPLAGVPLPRRLPLRHALLRTVAVGKAAERPLSQGLDRIIAATPRRGRGGYGAMLVRMVTALDAAVLTVPTLVIAGLHDRIAPVHRSRRIAEQLPWLVELVELETGHCGPLEAPDEVVAALRRILPAAAVQAV
ncbi:alpha/beta fold hydrolase [Nocardia grenadensis]|uniref:alpha/beta fold hydrolase n=1 Tax=Nocardia grenadensis TaxID=931537 RepID=UPI0007A4A256|nr:alpha/beta hydrolase [Nocardia grenadensis]